MPTPSFKTFHFGLFEFDPASLELARAGRAVRLKPQPAKVLAYLLARAGELVPRNDLQHHIWGDAYVDSEAGLNACIRDVRSALGDQVQAPTYVETVPRRGYRFIAWIYALVGNYDEAIRQCRKGIDLDPTVAWLHGCLVEAHRSRGDLGQALRAARREMQAKAADEQDLHLLDATPEIALANLDRWRLGRILKTSQEQYVPACAIGIRHAQAGLRDEALDFLEAAYEERSGFMPFLEVSDALRPLHGDPRFEDLAHRLRATMSVGG